MGLLIAAGTAAPVLAQTAPEPPPSQMGGPFQENDQPRTPPSRAKTDKPGPAPATDAAVGAYADHLVRDVRVVGLKQTDPTLVTNQIRTRAGEPLSPESVRGDVQRLNRLGKFREINAKIQPYSDGSVTLIYQFVETPVIAAVEAVGNRQLTDADIAPVISLLRDTPVDEFELGRARAAIEKLYRDKGYYQATVTVDKNELDKNGTVLFRINEGERVRVTDIRFEGNTSFEPKQLDTAIKTKVAGIFETGPVDNEQLDRDVASLAEFYRDRGYLDVRTDKQLVFSPNGKEAIVKFLIDEGPVYTLKDVRVELADESGQPTDKPTVVISPDQIAGLMEIKAGDVYSVDKVRKSIDSIRNAYAKMGYVDAGVGKAELRDPKQPQVELLLLVHEGKRFRTGIITIKGNELTQEKVIRRELDIKPDRPLDNSLVREGTRYFPEAERKLEETRLFAPGSPKVTVQPEDPANPGYRDVLVEVKETNTGSLGFGAGVSSDAGVIGQISLTQRNFDLFDTSDSWGELISGRAFRGAGQTFNLTVAPGTELQTYSISLADPYLFDSDYQGQVQGFYRRRQYDQYDENRLSGRVAVGRRFGERWTGNVTFRYDNVNISNIIDTGPQDLFDVEGGSSLTGVGFQLVRNTTDSSYRPTKGARTSLEVERVGALGGDYDFTRLVASHVVFFTLYEDFLGYKTTLQLKVSAAYIPEGKDHVPYFERLFLGGNSFRGFAFRTISPKAIEHDTGQIGSDPAGGTWSFFAGPEVTQPVFKDVLAVAAFIDTGTVTNSVGFSDYRVSAGVGLRLYVQQLGPVPLSFDFAVPLLSQTGDSRRFFSFSLDLPF